jgi:hypothetical protein
VRRDKRTHLGKNFHDEANLRFEKILHDGKVITWDSMCRYLDDLIAGKKPPKPEATTIPAEELTLLRAEHSKK